LEEDLGVFARKKEMRMRKETKYGFDTAEYRTGIHRIDKQTRIVSRAERGTLTPSEALDLSFLSSHKDIQKITQRVVSRARKTLGSKLQ
jgi:hypothetical protein